MTILQHEVGRRPRLVLRRLSLRLRECFRYGFERTFFAAQTCLFATFRSLSMRNKRLAFGSGLSILVLFLTLVIQLSMAQQNRTPSTDSSSFTEVEQLIAQGLPQSALEKLAPIIEQAIAAKNYPVAIRAVCTKAMLAANVEGNLAEEKIKRLESEINAYPGDMQPILNAILANWYWQFYQQNQWQFMQRTTADSSSNSDDILTWSLPQILNKVDEVFDRAFDASEQLKSAKTVDYQTLIDPSVPPEQLPDAAKYRPTISISLLTMRSAITRQMRVAPFK